jgi:hypothetical protein
MKCYNCENPDKPIVYFKYFLEPKKAIGLCYSCLIFLGFAKEVLAITPQLLICQQCKEKFVPRKNKARCGVCWAKYFQSQVKPMEIVK